MTEDTEAREIARGLTKAQREALLWLHDRDHNKSEWTRNGKRLRATDKPETWTHLKISGVASILIAQTDLKALHGLTEPARGPGRCRLYALSPLGLRVRAILMEQEQ
jgi:hypothetical protein